MNILRSHL